MTTSTAPGATYVLLVPGTGWHRPAAGGGLTLCRLPVTRRWPEST